ncbi:MAG: YeeE/YedE family protein [Devosiaceae bacterium]|nr:YeeE/YedE family protein [Devosiaceae bacterium]
MSNSITHDNVTHDNVSSSVTNLAYLAVAVLSGGLFGAGLYISQMIDPLKVLRFLDFGAISQNGWDPSLALVIIGAIAVMMVSVLLTKSRSAPLFDKQFHLPALKQIDRPLIIGAVLFGIGWGMSGICPGPAITLVAFMPENLLIFLGLMFLGSFLGTYVQKWFANGDAIA